MALIDATPRMISGRADHDAGAGAGQAEFREAVGQHDMGSPNTESRRR